MTNKKTFWENLSKEEKTQLAAIVDVSRGHLSNVFNECPAHNGVKRKASPGLCHKIINAVSELNKSRSKNNKLKLKLLDLRDDSF